MITGLDVRQCLDLLDLSCAPEPRPVYDLYDNHVAALLDQAVYHIEHLRLGIADSPAGAAVTATAG